MAKHLIFVFLLVLGTLGTAVAGKGKRGPKQPPHWEDDYWYPTTCRMGISTPRFGIVARFQAGNCKQTRRQCQRALRRYQRQGHYMRGQCIQLPSWDGGHQGPQRKCKAVLKTRRYGVVERFKRRNCRRAMRACRRALRDYQYRGWYRRGFCKVKRRRGY